MQRRHTWSTNILTFTTIHIFVSGFRKKGWTSSSFPGLLYNIHRYIKLQFGCGVGSSVVSAPDCNRGSPAFDSRRPLGGGNRFSELRQWRIMKFKLIIFVKMLMKKKNYTVPKTRIGESSHLKIFASLIKRSELRIYGTWSSLWGFRRTVTGTYIVKK